MLPELLKSAMLGTGQFVPTATSPLAREVQEKVAPKTQDKEDAFLKLAAGYFLLENAGRQLPSLALQHPAPPPESAQLLSPEANALLRQFIVHKEEQLLEYALFKCTSNQKVVSPELVPDVLTMALEKKNLREALVRVSGARGAWLAQLNSVWGTLFSPEEESVWETGTWEQRLIYFRKLRAQEPEKALELLQATMQEENANARAELLGLLRSKLSPTDEPFLIAQLSDKSLKVKQEVYNLLLQLPTSQLNLRVQSYLKAAVQVKEVRYLLLAKKKVFVINPEVPVPAELFAAGFEKTSSQKNVDDGDYWVSQAMVHAHPTFWAETYGISLDEVVQLWASHEARHLFLPALVACALRYQHPELAKALLQNKEVMAPELLVALPLADRFLFASKFKSEQPAHYLQTLLTETYPPIPLEVNKPLLEQFAKNPYTITHQQYQRWALQMEADMLPVLQKYAQADDHDYQMRFFRNVCTEMTRLLYTKDQLNALL